MKHKTLLVIITALISFASSFAQTPKDIKYTVSPSATSSEFTYDNILTGSSDWICQSGDQLLDQNNGLAAIIQDVKHMASWVDLERIGGSHGESAKAKVKIRWNSCVEGVIRIPVYYKSKKHRIKIVWTFFGPTPKGECYWTEWRYMYTYVITRTKLNPAGELTVIGNPSRIATDAQGYTTFTLSYLPSSDYKNFPGVKKIRYRNASDATVDTEANLVMSPTGYLKTTITYRAKGFGNFTVNAVVFDNCKPFTLPGKTVTVKPSCYNDNPSLVKIKPQGVPEDGTFANAYEVKTNTNYSITVDNATDIQANYEWTLDGKVNGTSPDITFNNNSFTMLKAMGSFRIGLAVKSDGLVGMADRTYWCTTPLNPMKIFVGGRDHKFTDVCNIELPKDFGKLGFPNIDLKDISLKHFAGYVESQRTITVMPGMTLDEGAELFIETSPQAPSTDLKMNFTEQTSYDEYGRILGASRSYFDDNGRPLQTQAKDISRDVILANATLYDAFGRPAISTLAAPIKSGTPVELQCADDTKQEITQLEFGYKADFVQAANKEKYGYSHFDLNNELSPVAVDGATEGTLGWYYSSHNGSSTNKIMNEPLVATTKYPYSRTLFKHDGSGDTKSVTKPGDTFNAGSAYLATSEPEIVKAQDEYLNKYLDMRAAELSLPRPTVIEGEFHKSIMTDEVGKKSVTYTDQGGKTIITLYLGNPNDPATPVKPITKSFQFYDNAGRLMVSISPNGLEQYDKNIDFSLIDKTRYFYNSKGLLAASEEKDGGRSEYMYRRDGKIRFSQNAEQRKAVPERYSYTNYDNAGRPIESGEYTKATDGIAFNSPEMKAILESTAVDGGIAATAATKTNRTFSYYDEPNSTLRTQRFVQGAVSYMTKENTITTWYSYDERGRVEWIIQDITGFGIKTIDYRYGPTGQVQDVTYQKSKPDQFVHFYEYDKDGRLFKAYTSRLDLEYKKTGELNNPGILELQATYFYYLHGPLKRVELANKLQGIDYVYTINGALKAINHADPLKDPGNDGPANGFNPDVFGMTLDYFTGDYTGAGYDAGTLTTVNGTYDEQYTGLIKATRWHSPVEPGKQFGYGYAYDNRNQFKQADWGTVAGSIFTHVPKDPYKESIGDYDANGNITSLQRNTNLSLLKVDNINLAIADFTYHYKLNSNKLENITEPDGNDGTKISRAYEYNDLGQMTKETEGDDKSKFVTYDVTGKVTAVYAGPAQTLPVTTFDYDDRGFRLAKTTYDKDHKQSKRTWYVRDASGNMLTTYEENLKDAKPPIATEAPVYGAGKIGLYKPEFGSTFYELTDHLGNVRAVIGKELTLTYTATMESELHDKEVKDGFMNLKSSGPAIFNTTPDQVVDGITVVGDEANKVNNQPAPDGTRKPIGVGKMVCVQPGDKIRAEVMAKYTDFNSSNNPLAGLAGFLTTVFPNPSAAIDAAPIFNIMNDSEAIALAGASPFNETQPRAFLNYILFDNNFKLVACKSKQVSIDAKLTDTNQAPERLAFEDLAIEKEGFMYYYVSNMSDDQNMNVYFDDLTITHTGSNIVSGGDFYPYGLAIKDRQIERHEYRFGYQGQFAEKDEETGWNHFELREYDPIIGRWTSTDPKGQFFSPYVGMGNNPVSGVDPDGGYLWGMFGSTYKQRVTARAFRDSFGGEIHNITDKSISVTYSSWDYSSEIFEMTGDPIMASSGVAVKNVRFNEDGSLKRIFNDSFYSQVQRSRYPSGRVDFDPVTQITLGLLVIAAPAAGIRVAATLPELGYRVAATTGQLYWRAGALSNAINLYGSYYARNIVFSTTLSLAPILGRSRFGIGVAMKLAQFSAYGNINFTKILQVGFEKGFKKSHELFD